MVSNVNTLMDDLSRLDALISKTDLTEEEGIDVAELIKRLENAEGVAGEVEGRIDDILAKLDGILEEIDVPEKDLSSIGTTQSEAGLESQTKRD